MSSLLWLPLSVLWGVARLEEDDWEEVEFQLKKKKLGTSIPRDEDLHGAAQALIRLQDVYELDIRDLSKGVYIIHLIC